MRKIIVTLFLVIISNSAISQWTWVNPYPQGNVLTDLTFSDNTLFLTGNYGTILKTSNNGLNWIFTFRSLDNNSDITSIFKLTNEIYYGTQNESNSIIKSTNSGLNWDVISSPNQFGEINSVFFLDENNGFVISSYTDLFKTTDGGNSWILSLVGSSADGYLDDVYFLNNDTGIVCGGNSFFYAKLIRMTTNGGLNWFSVLPDGVDELTHIQFLNTKTGYITNHNGVFKTTNSGYNWEFKANQNFVNIRNLHFIDAEMGFLISSSHDFHKTTNGGDNWVTLYTPNFGQKEIVFKDANTGYVLGWENILTMTTNGGNNWNVLIEPLSNSSAPSRLYSTNFINSSTGFAVGWNSILTKTTNAGINWYMTTIHNIDRHLIDISFINNVTGYSILYDSHYGNLLKSTDTGENWYLIDTIGSTSNRLKKIHFINSTSGFILDDNGNLFKTYDSGNNWDPIYNVPGNRELWDIDFSQESGFFIRLGNNEASIYKTTDYGDNWTHNYTYPKDLLGVKWLDNNTAFLVGRGILKTTNGGISWEEKFTGNTQDYLFRNVFFPTINIGFAIGQGYGNLEGVAFKTTNGGETWLPIRLPTNHSIHDLHFFSSNTGILVGNKINILRTTNGGGNFISSISQTGTRIPEGFVLKQNYPNPFNPTTNISFDIPKYVFVELKVYDIRGRFITKLLADFVSPGSYNYIWDAAELSSGVYFYTLKAGDFVSTKKMLLLK